MKSGNILILIIALVIISTSYSVIASAIDTYEFRDELAKVRFQVLSKELRCPKCQNQNLADSNSPIAADLRKELYELVQQGKADSEIVDFMVSRYGEFVLYRPRVSTLTYVLWFSPVIFILIGVVVVIVVIRQKPVNKTNLTLTTEQQDKLKNLLNNK